MKPFELTNLTTPRSLDLPKLAADSDILLCCITADDVDQFCDDYAQPPLTDEEMDELFYVLNDDSRSFEMLYDAVDEVRGGALRRDLASTVTGHIHA